MQLLAVVFDEDLYIDEEAAQRAYDRARQDDVEYGDEPYERILAGRYIYTKRVLRVTPWLLDSLYHDQGQAVDPQMFTRAPQRKARNGFDADLIGDYE